MIRWILMIVFLLSTSSIWSQQLPIFSLEQSGNVTANPALRSHDMIKYDWSAMAKVNYRKQWVNIENAPETISAQFDYWNEDQNLLLGGQLLQDQTGPTSYSGLYLKGGYGFNISDDWYLMTAIGAGLVQFRIKAAELHFLEEGDIAQENTTTIYPDVSLGAIIHFKKYFYAGISAPSVLGLDLSFKDQSNQFKIQRVQHYEGTIGGMLPLDESWIEGSIYVKHVNAVPTLYGAKVRYDHNNNFWIGLGGASSGAISFDAGLRLALGRYGTPLSIGYVFTNYFAEYGAQFGTVHDFQVSFYW